MYLEVHQGPPGGPLRRLVAAGFSVQVHYLQGFESQDV